MLFTLTIQSRNYNDLASSKTIGFESTRIENLVTKVNTGLTGTSEFDYVSVDGSVIHYTASESVATITGYTQDTIANSTGTTSNTFKIDSDNATSHITLKNNSGVLDVLDKAGTGYAAVKALTLEATTSATIGTTLSVTGDTTVSEVINTDNVGTASSNVTAVEYGDGHHHKTVLTISGMTLTIAGAAAEATGAQIYEFPAGVHAHKVTHMSVALQGGGTVDADTPDVGIGSVAGTGAVSVLSGTATFEDYVTGQTAADCGGTATVKMTGATAGYGTGISLNESGDEKSVFFNVADTWAGADTVTVSGTVVLEWTTIA